MVRKIPYVLPINFAQIDVMVQSASTFHLFANCVLVFISVTEIVVGQFRVIKVWPY